MLEHGFTVGFEPLGSGDAGRELRRLEGGDKGPCDGVVYLEPPDIEAEDAAAFDEHLAGAVVTWRPVAPAVVRTQMTAAMAAIGDTLQKGAPLSHSSSRFVWSRPCILSDAGLIGFISLPVDEARMMIRNEHLPFGTRQHPKTLAPRAGGIQHRLGTSLAISIGAGIDGIGQHVVDGGVACVDPANWVSLVHMQWKAEAF